MPLTQIREYLDGIEPGKLNDEQVSEVTGLLFSCWHRLPGGEEGGMVADKLCNRTEEMEWRAPSLTFKIERHGGMVNGSSRAEIQHWNIDLNHGTAGLAGTGWRQKHPPSPRIDIKTIATEIATLIHEGLEDSRLKWLETNSVKVLVGEIIPDTNKQTTSSRRKRFRDELERVLKAFRWNRKSSGSHLIFERSDADHQFNDFAS